MEKRAKPLFTSNQNQQFSFLKRVCHLPKGRQQGSNERARRTPAHLRRTLLRTKGTEIPPLDPSSR